MIKIKVKKIRKKDNYICDICNEIDYRQRCCYYEVIVTDDKYDNFPSTTTICKHCLDDIFKQINEIEKQRSKK